MEANSHYKLLQNATLLVHDDKDHVQAQYNTDLLVKGEIIQDIGSNLTIPSGEKGETIDCTGKIISPGFIDTHHHLWQTQLKGRHADETLLQYFPSGMFQSYHYQPSDIFWGQLAGSLEAIDAGTTLVLDHAHGSYTREHAEAGLKASVASGLRMIYAQAPPIKLKTWDKQQCVTAMDENPLPDWHFEFVEDKCKEQPIEGRVSMGFGFDQWFMPKEFVQGVFGRARKSGIKIMTNHVNKSAYMFDPVHLMRDYGLLANDMVVSHAVGLGAEKNKILYDAGVYISSTPETECQMGMGCPVALDDDVLGSLGIDCHTNNSSSILIQARMLLQQVRQRDGQKSLDNGVAQKSLTGTSEQVFNLATIGGARAVNMENEIGSIKKGKKADLVIFDPTSSPSMLCAVEWDPLVAVLRHSDLRDIDTVIVGGVVRKQGGKILPVKVDGKDCSYSEVVKSTSDSRKAVQQRIDGTSWDEAYKAISALLHVDEKKLV